MFLANENFPVPGVYLLRERGYPVRCIMEEKRGLDDYSIIRMARANGLIILTFDRDYGEIVFRMLAEEPPADVFFRSKGQTPGDAANVLLRLLSDKNFRLHGGFTVISNNSVRQRHYR